MLQQLRMSGCERYSDQVCISADVTVEVLLQLRMVGCERLQTRARCRSYGYDCRCAAATDGRVRATADACVQS